MRTLQIRLLGDFQVMDDCVALTALNAPRLQSLLTYLVLHRGAPQARPYLAFVLWPDSSETRARTSLRGLFHTLRHVLPESERFLRTDVSSIEWLADAPFTLDVSEFEAAIAQAASAVQDDEQRRGLERAIQLYRGELLPSCYEDWIVPERERLSQLHGQALQQLVSLLEKQRKYRAAIRYAEQLVQKDPLVEEPYRLLMRLHAHSGDRVGVLRTYQTCATVLQHELMLEPSTWTREAFAQFSQAVPPPAARPSAAQPQAPAAPSVQHNLPFPLTSFIGRERERADVIGLLSGTRLLSLTGSGGSGKTRLALQVAHELAATRTFADGIAWVELAGLNEEALVSKAVASAVAAGEQPGRTLEDVLVETFRPRQLLLVLDNCEHLIAACVQLITRLLGGAPGVRILATSREVLNVIGETRYPLAPLALPPVAPQGPGPSVQQATHESSPAPREAGAPSAWQGHALRTQDLMRYDAIRLFVERAATVLPTFRLTQANAPSIAEICRQLDGLPLAIELAAARVKLLSVEQIAQRLDRRFSLLTSGNRAALPRHQSLRAAIDWSHDLLSEPERVLFRRLSVFAGGLTLDAAEAVCNPDAALDVLNGLAALMDKSLLQQADSEAEPRLLMLDTIRAYAHTCLDNSAERDWMRRQHAAYFLRMAESAGSMAFGSEHVLWQGRLQRDHDNLRAGLEWMIESREAEPELALRMTWALRPFWYTHGNAEEARYWLTAALEKGKDAPAASRARALTALGALQVDREQAIALYEESLGLYRALGREEGRVLTMRSLATELRMKQDYVRATTLLEESLEFLRAIDRLDLMPAELQQLARMAAAQHDHARARALGEESLSLSRRAGHTTAIAWSLYHLGDLARARGDDSQAAELYDQSLALARQLKLTWCVASALRGLGFLALHRGDARQAADLFAEDLTLTQTSHLGLGTAESLTGLAGVALAASDPLEAARLFGAVQAWLDRANRELDPIDRAEHERYWQAACGQLEPAEFERALQAGRTQTLEQAIAGARRWLEQFRAEAPDFQ